VIDSHCHIAGSEFESDLSDVVNRARTAGVSASLVILAADDAAELGRAATVAATWPEVRFAIGIHPHAAGTFAQDTDGAARCVEDALAAQPAARALGEIGLDYHYDFAPRDIQQAVFSTQLHIAASRNLPVVIHTREADEDTFRMLREDAPPRRGVLHCFTGDREAARRGLDLGFYISLSGIVTFPRALELKEVAKLVPLDRLLIETDSPFLAPVPYRGKRNEPAHVARVAEVIAELRQVHVEAITDATTENFRRLFTP
jgi:TatD DNase family protein